MSQQRVESQAEGAGGVAPFLSPFPSETALPGLLAGFSTRGAGSIARPTSWPASGLDDALARRLPSGLGRYQPRQVHGRRVIDVDREGATAPPEADAVLTRRPDRVVAVLTADCLPVLLVAHEAERPVAVAAVHAGWRGLTAGIVEAGVDAVRQQHPNAEIQAALGPAIGPCCFEIGEEVVTALVDRAGDATVVREPGRKPHGDLPRAARIVLEDRGVRVGPAGPCTRCRPDHFHSYRAVGAEAGRMVAYVGWRTTG